jgi:hypothetical protein
MKEALGSQGEGCAGQAVVQMARGKHDRRDYAIKFFAYRQGFHAEHALYCSGSQAQASELAQFLPKVCPYVLCHPCDPFI